MRRCIAGIFAGVACCRQIDIYQHAFRGSNRSCCAMERMSPRTATIDEVTSTAQIAIWTTSNTSAR